jgi:putative peptide zinc metalloprotease protein
MERPKMAAVEVVDPVPGRDDVVVFCPHRDRYVRVQGPQWAFLRSLDGRRTVAELEVDFSERFPDGMVRPLLARFAEVGLLEGCNEDAKQLETRRRLRVTHLGVIQFSLGDPDRFLDRLLPLIRLLAGPVGRISSALMVVVGLCSMLLHADLAARGLQRLTGPVWTVTLMVAVALCVVLHELGHAAAVKYYGGRVRRMGLMLFYLTPAMFCDTSDAWRFPRNRQRVIVAAAGIWVQMVIAGIAQTVLWLPLSAETAAWLWYFAAFNLGLCVVNLIPFVQLDGYWVLVAFTDVPNLRSRALHYVRATTLRVVAGISQPQMTPPKHPVLTLLFGVGCLLFPPVLLLSVLLDFQHVLLRLGQVGAAAWLFLAGSVAAVPRKGLLRIVRSARGWSGRAQLRAGLLGITGVLVIAGIFAVVRIPLTVQGRFEVSNTEGIIAVLPARTYAPVRPGDRVQLRAPSIVDRTPIAEGMLSRGLPSGTYERRYQVVIDHGSDISRTVKGPLSVRAGEAPIPAWFGAVYLQPAWATLTGAVSSAGPSSAVRGVM